MIQKLTDVPRDRYNSLLPDNTRRDDPRYDLPATLPHRGEIFGPFAYVLPDQLLHILRESEQSRGGESVYLFFTEYWEGQDTDFEIDLPDLTYDKLKELGPLENVITNKDFSWALYMHHEGGLHVSGPEELFNLLRQGLHRMAADEADVSSE